MVRQNDLTQISTHDTPLGPLWGGFSHHALVILSFKPLQHPIPRISPHPLEHALRLWLERYFAKCFAPPTFPLAPKGTVFQQTVWREVSKINAGKWLTYGALAKQLNTAPRAIGQAMAANPIPLLIPCHRIIAQNKKIGGYSGGEGEKTKYWLLQWEGGAFCPSGKDQSQKQNLGGFAPKPPLGGMIPPRPPQ